MYHGRIDENYEDAAKVTSPDLKNALDALLAGQPVAKAETKAFGCSIKRAMTRIRDLDSDPRAAAAALLLFPLAASGRAADATLLKGELDAQGAFRGHREAEGPRRPRELLGHLVRSVPRGVPRLRPPREGLPRPRTAPSSASRPISRRTSPRSRSSWRPHHPDFPNYRKKSGGDDQDFIESVDAKWGGELPFTVLYGKDGRKTRGALGKAVLRGLEKAIAPLLK